MANSVHQRRILICDPVDKSCLDQLKRAGYEIDEKFSQTEDELIKMMPNYNAALVRSSTQVTGPILEACRRNGLDQLKLIGRAGTGVDNIDVATATKLGIVVMNTPDANSLSAAEHTCALLMALCRHVPAGCVGVKNGKWNRKLIGRELSDKTLGLIGVGRVGRMVAERMQAFGMRTIAYDPFVSRQQGLEFNVHMMDTVKEVLESSDMLSVHTPLLETTKHMLNSDAFDQCRRGFLIVNCARGGIIDEAALLDALNDGRCGGAALDVFETEPPTAVGLQLAQHDAVVCTPHLGASTVEAQRRVAQHIGRQMVAFFEENSTVGVVNRQLVD